MSSTDLTQTDLVKSITGYDELAVEKFFAGVDLYPDEQPDKPLRYMRALVFIHKRHDKVKDAEAAHEALDLPVSAVTDYFAAEPDDDVADEVAESDLGKAEQ